MPIKDNLMAFNFGSFIVKALGVALIADQAFEETQAPGANASIILQPNNFENLLLELSQVISTPTSTATSVSSVAAVKK